MLSRHTLPRTPEPKAGSLQTPAKASGGLNAWRYVQRKDSGKVGSGSLEKDSPIEIIAIEKQKQARLVHHQRLGERERHADKTGETLA